MNKMTIDNLLPNDQNSKQKLISIAENIVNIMEKQGYSISYSKMETLCQFPPKYKRGMTKISEFNGHIPKSYKRIYKNDNDFSPIPTCFGEERSKCA